MVQKDLLVICGPTGVGKTNFVIELASVLNAEIISADSMQIYKSLDIGTAKPTPKQQNSVPHHMIDLISPLEEFNAALFAQMAKEKIAQVQKRGNLPILTGGTGLYLQSILSGYDFKDKGRKAIEEGAFNSLMLCLNCEREILYQNIDRRVDDMIAAGLVKEVEVLYQIGVREDAACMKAIGYKEFLPYLNNKISLQEAIAEVKQNTRNYAKRQLTWFRGMSGLIWINIPNEQDKAKELIINKFSKYKKQNT